MNSKIPGIIAAIATLITALGVACDQFSEHYVIVPVKRYGVMDDLPERLTR